MKKKNYWATAGTHFYYTLICCFEMKNSHGKCDLGK